MKTIKRTFFVTMAAMVGMAASSARANMVITEWMYQGLGTSGVGEFVQFTNTGSTPVNMTGWQFDDNHELGTTAAGPGAGPASLSGFGILQPGQSGILTEVSAATFDANWNLDPSVPVIGGNTQNLGRSDEINLYDNTSTLVDRLTYNDQATSGNTKGPRTQGAAAYIPLAAQGTNNASAAALAVVGDGNGSRASSLNEIGNPGPVATPEPASIRLLAMAGMFLRRRGRSQKA